MSDYYRGKRTTRIYDPESSEPFKLSRSRIDLFMQCPRCFYIDRRLGVDRPPGFPFALNSAVDALLKREFDVHRANGEAHPLMKRYGVDAVPAPHEKLNVWRENFKGVEHLHESTNFLVTGAIDDLWKNKAGEYIVVDYKATSKAEDIVSLDKKWHDAYKRQMEIYQWLLRKNGLPIASTGYFVYCNGRADAKAFDGKIEFDVTLIPYEGDDSWVEGTLKDIHACLNSSTVPQADPDCDYCTYVREVKDF